MTLPATPEIRSAARSSGIFFFFLEQLLQGRADQPRMLNSMISRSEGIPFVLPSRSWLIYRAKTDDPTRTGCT